MQFEQNVCFSQLYYSYKTNKQVLRKVSNNQNCFEGVLDCTRKFKCRMILEVHGFGKTDIKFVGSNFISY